jgi:exopolyphosphatase/guanosine-5'-triphosphate,3'-diphosphate pyrophosphatase
MRLLQAVDIGTNSTRSIIVEVAQDGSYRVIDDEKAMTRLGQGLATSGALSEDAMDRTIRALNVMADIGRSRGVDHVRAVATEAVRSASNRQGFLSRVQKEVGLSVEVMAPEEEGRLVWLSAAPLASATTFAAVVDVGGGSVEVVQALSSEPVSITSMRLGVRVLTDRFMDTEPVSDRAFKRLRRHVKRTLRGEVKPLAPNVVTLIGSGGTVTAIAALVAGVRGRRYESAHGLEIARTEVMQLMSKLSRSTAAERMKMSGMPPDRVDVILAGTLVVAEAMKLFGAASILVNARGFREGIVLDTLASQGAAGSPVDPLNAVRGLASRYRYDREHAEQVARLALSIFDQAAGTFALDPSWRILLESAALLHDVGYYIAYDRHHRHSYHLILNSALPGFTQRDLALVASIARYHTKALPKRSHESWSTLDPGDRATVRSLASILRIADGLDRGRGARIRRVTVDDDGSTTRFLIDGDGDLHAEVYGFEKKRDLFEDTFGRSARVEVSEGGDGLF